MTVQTEFWKERLHLPSYRVGEAASYAEISPQTVAAWESKKSEAKSALSRRQNRKGISFLELIEIAIVADLRREGVKLSSIRTARDYFHRTIGEKFPFAKEKFKTDGVNILLSLKGSDGEELQDRMIVADENGQLIWADFLYKSLKEFDYLEGSVVRWRLGGEFNRVLIDPRICFGAPTVDGIMTRAILSEWKNEVSVDEIAEDFGISSKSVKDALLFEKVIF